MTRTVSWVALPAVIKVDEVVACGLQAAGIEEVDGSDEERLVDMGAEVVPRAPTHWRRQC